MRLILTGSIGIVLVGYAVYEWMAPTRSCEESYHQSMNQWVFKGPEHTQEHCKVHLATKRALNKLAGALELYNLDNANYPSAEQGLAALLEKPKLPPEPRSYYPNGYIQSLPKDPWGSDFVYSGELGAVFIQSFGADGIPGGEGTNADLMIEKRYAPFSPLATAHEQESID